MGNTSEAGRAANDWGYEVDTLCRSLNGSDRPLPARWREPDYSVCPTREAAPRLLRVGLLDFHLTLVWLQFSCQDGKSATAKCHTVELLTLSKF